MLGKLRLLAITSLSFSNLPNAQLLDSRARSSFKAIPIAIPDHSGREAASRRRINGPFCLSRSHARERHSPRARTRRDWRCGVSARRAERVMRGAARIGEGRGHADSCMTRDAIGRWTPYRHHTAAPLVARARHQMSLVTNIRRERAITRRERKREGERRHASESHPDRGSFRGAR